MIRLISMLMVFLCLFGNFALVFPPEIWTVGVTYPNGANMRNFIGVQVKASEDTVEVQYWLFYPNGTIYSNESGKFMEKWKYPNYDEWYYFYTCWYPPESGWWTLILFAYYRHSNYLPNPDIASVKFYITERIHPLPSLLTMDVINIRQIGNEQIRRGAGGGCFGPRLK